MDQEPPEERIHEDGMVWLGSRAELESWKKYKRRKALAFVERGYSVSWRPDMGAWMSVFEPERHEDKSPEVCADFKFFGRPSEYGIDGGMVSKLMIYERRTDPVKQAVGKPHEKTRVLYNYDRGLDFDHLSRNPAPRRLYDTVIEEVN